MTIVLNDPVNVGVGAVLFSWTSDAVDPLFRITKNGLPIQSTRSNRVVLMCLPSDVIAVSDDGSNPADEGAEASLEISWPAVASSAFYKIEEETSPGSGTFDVRAVIRDDGRSRFLYNTAPFVDDVATVYRVTPIGTNGNDGTPTSFNRTVPRHPSAPDVTVTFSDSTKKVTIAAA